MSFDKCALSDQDAQVEMSKQILYPTEDTIPAEKLNLLCKYYYFIVYQLILKQVYCIKFSQKKKKFLDFGQTNIT